MFITCTVCEVRTWTKLTETHIINLIQPVTKALKKEMKVKVKVKFNLEQATKVHRGSTGIALLFL